MVNGVDFAHTFVERFRWVDGYADIRGLLADGAFLADVAEALAAPFRTSHVTKVAGVGAFANSERYVNPITRPVAKKLPTFAILTHRGRKTGRTYRMPINVFHRGPEYFFFLTYGSDVQWVKNVLAVGSCSIETRGRVVELVEPELITDPELRPAPPHVRFVERRIVGATQYLRMRAGDRPSGLDSPG
jgi:deazaflavin-dependent oxidoreductase (nitroreductase family)